MITVKRLALAYKSFPLTSELTDAYAIIQCCESEYYCQTITSTDGKLNWSFETENVRLAAKEREICVKFKIIDYASCKTIDVLQLQFQDVNFSSKVRSIAKQFQSKNGPIQIHIQYLCERAFQAKRVEDLKSFDGASKKTCTTNHEQSSIWQSNMQKTTSSKLIPNRQMDSYNLGSYCSPKNSDYHLKGYRQSKEPYLYESISLRKIASYKLLI